MLKKSILPTLLVISFFAFGLGISHAEEVTFLGTTSGAFNGGAPSTTPTTLLGLTYQPGGFSTTTVGGISALTLGGFQLNPGSATYTGSTFELHVNFIVPSGIAGTGGQVATFNAILLGAVTDLGSGGVGIVFLNPLQSFSYSNVGGSGSFSLLLNNVALTPGPQPTGLTGLILGAQHNPNGGGVPVPEPSTLLLLGTGLVGLAGVRRSSSRKKSA